MAAIRHIAAIAFLERAFGFREIPTARLVSSTGGGHSMQRLQEVSR